VTGKPVIMLSVFYLVAAGILEGLPYVLPPESLADFTIDIIVLGAVFVITLGAIIFAKGEAVESPRFKL
jgi:hypothetical protein